MTIICHSCKGVCTGEVLKVQEKHFHIDCFSCKVCGSLLASGGYFMKNDCYYCSRDYHIEFGTKCKACGEYVEGRVVTALGNSYHPKCFSCDRCKGEINSGTVVTYNDRQEILCQKCTDIALNEETEDMPIPTTITTTTPSPEGRGSKSSHSSSSGDRTERQVQQEESNNQNNIQSNKRMVSYSNNGDNSADQLNDMFDYSKVPDVDPVTRTRLGKCSGCGESIRSCQSLIALDRHWHLFCFTCSVCNKLLTSEYMTKKDKPYCETCYHDSFGVMCSTCRQFITGKVLEAGEKSFHPACAFCCKCSLSFGEGEDMCVSGNDIWHLDCDRAETAAIRAADSETSSEDSRSRTQSLTTPSPTGSGRHSSKLFMSRESSAGELVSKELAVYPLKELQLIGTMRLPRDVNRTKLEQHLSDEEFHRVFGTNRASFYCLQMWKQLDLKKKANLF